MESEVLVGQVAPTDDRGPPVYDQRLVVHAVIGPRELAEVEQLAQHHVVRAVAEGVVDPELDIGVLVDCMQHQVLVHGERVVEHQPDAHPPVGSGHEVGQDLEAAGVRLPQEGFHVDRDPRAVDGTQAPVQGLLPAVQQVEPVVGLVGRDGLPEGRCGRRQRRRRGVGVIEAPRGTLIHHYRVDEHDQVVRANLIVSTTHNNEAMNRAIRAVARRYLDGRTLTEGLLNHIEVAVRAFDPCLSCATHALGKMPLAVELAARLEAAELPGVEVIVDFQLQVEHALDLEHRELAVFIDAAVDLAGPYELRPVSPSRDRSHTTHALSPAAVLETFERCTGRTPPRALVLAVKGEQFELGTELSTAAQANLEAAWQALRASIPAAS